MRFKPFLVGLLCVWCTWELAALGQIVVPPESEVHSPVVASLAASIPDGAQVQGGWTLPSGKLLPCGQSVHVWAPPGKHTIGYRGVWIKTRPLVIEGETVQVLENFGFIDETATFVVKGGGPDPGPDPPVPPPSRRWALVVEESSQRTPAQSSLLVTLRSEYQGRLLIADKDTSAPKLQQWVSQVPAGSSLPVLVIASTDGALIRVVPMPITVEAFRQEMSR